MNKILIPLILTATVMIAGIFAFMPVDEAITVHTTLQSATQADTQTTTITNTQFNNVKSAFDTDLSSNSSATCTSGSFLVYYTFTNDTLADVHTTTALGIDNSTGDGIDLAVTLSLGNQSSVSGIIGGLAGEVITFSGNSTNSNLGTVDFEDVGDLHITVLCQSTATAIVNSE